MAYVYGTVFSKLEFKKKQNKTNDGRMTGLLYGAFSFFFAVTSVSLPTSDPIGVYDCNPQHLSDLVSLSRLPL